MVDDLLNKIHLGDCLEFMRDIPDGSVDMVLTDPPYKVISGGNQKGLSYKHKGSITEKNDGKIFKHNDITPSVWIPTIYDKLKQDSHCYIMTNVLNMKDMLTISEKCGFKLHNILVWEKQNCTPSRWYMKNGEYILFLRKGKAKPINNKGSKTVHKFTNPFGEKLHPTEKSTEHMRFFIENSTCVGDVVLDPFSGSGTTAIAAERTGRRWICVEKDPDYHAASVKRLEEHQRQGKLF